MTSTNNPSKDITESLDYQAFIESMVHLCHCDRDRPCDGVLAGGLCDGVIHDLWDEDDDRCEDDDHD